MFRAKPLKTNWLQKTIEYQTNELSTNYNHVKLALVVFAST